MIIVVWVALSLVVSHKQLGGPSGAEMRDMLVPLAVLLALVRALQPR